MAQPPLNAQIRQLEERVGAALFERGSRRVELTAAGEALSPAARAALSAVERGAATVRSAASGARRRAECLA